VHLHLKRLKTIPGIGKVLALTILYEIGDLDRFDKVQEFASSAPCWAARLNVTRCDNNEVRYYT
jgi:transposase